jgi:LAS superfamily LD-carboxypeptidase LdcB
MQNVGKFSWLQRFLFPEFTLEVAIYDSNNHDILTGVTERHLIPIQFPEDRKKCLKRSSILIHKQALKPFSVLRSAAASEGFDLRICSGFRSFQRQKSIWNEKLLGLRPVFDNSGKLVVLDHITDLQKVHSVLRWSALPGSSRHHWGTDFDIYDASALPKGYQIKLVPEECEKDGVFGDLHAWLSEFFSFYPNGFFRPYAFDRGGVSPEKWHISYGPIANVYAKQLTKEIIRDAIILDGEVKYTSVILQFFDEILDRYVLM